MIGKLPQHLEACLSAQERFERIRVQALLRHGRGLCDLSYANAYDGPAPEVIAAIRHALDAPGVLDLQYTPYGGSTITRRLVAQSLSESTGLHFNWRDIVMTPGAMAALNIVFRAVQSGDWTDEVIVVTPCWLDYPVYLSHLRLRPVFVPVQSGSLHLDLDRIKEAIGPRTKALILSQPANPTGILYTEDELRELAGLLRGADHEILLISDECHRDVIFGGHGFVSPSRYYDSTCIVYSFGKSHFVQGQRIGYAAVSPRMTERHGTRLLLERLCRVMGFCTPTALMQLAVRNMLDIKPDLSRIAVRRERVLSELTASGYTLMPSQATFFLYPQTTGPDDVAFTEELSRKGVLVLPAAMFHHEGHVRISLTATDEMFDKALPILQEAAGRCRTVTLSSDSSR
jgi:aspartate aminotransferase